MATTSNKGLIQFLFLHVNCIAFKEFRLFGLE